MLFHLCLIRCAPFGDRWCICVLQSRGVNSCCLCSLSWCHIWSSDSTLDSKNCSPIWIRIPTTIGNKIWRCPTSSYLMFSSFATSLFQVSGVFEERARGRLILWLCVWFVLYSYMFILTFVCLLFQAVFNTQVISQLASESIQLLKNLLLPSPTSPDTLPPDSGRSDNGMDMNPAPVCRTETGVSKLGSQALMHSQNLGNAILALLFRYSSPSFLYLLL